MIEIRNKQVLATLGTLVLTCSAVAQQAEVERCRQADSDAERIACLEAALLAKEASNEPEGIGASQVVARTQTREELLQQLEKAAGLTVARYETVPYERLQVTLENGQVWRQISGDTQKIRVDLQRNQTVDITESSLSGYKMQLNELRRTIRVERIQ